MRRVDAVILGASILGSICLSARDQASAAEQNNTKGNKPVTIGSEDDQLTASSATELKLRKFRHKDKIKKPMPTPQLGPMAEGDSYVPETLGKMRSFTLPAGHTWFVPVMASLAQDPGRTPNDPLPWQNDLYNLFGLTTYVGRYMRAYVAQHADPFGLAIDNGPAYPTTIPPATVRLIEYNSIGCLPANQNPATPTPPTFTAAKAAADAYCQTLCGQGFEMTDFDMNQWKHICYNFNPGTGQKSYNVITWGGTQCEKTVDNGLVQACNPVTGVIEVRNNLNQPSTVCPNCDKDGDGLVTLKDLVIERNSAFGPRRQALGLTFPVIYPTGKTVNQTMDLTSYVYSGADIMDVDYIEITGWNVGIPVNCLNPGEQGNYLDDLTKSNPLDSTLLNQTLANAWCQARAYNICVAGALGVTFGHCRINKDGTHSIRAAAGYCLKCA